MEHCLKRYFLSYDPTESKKLLCLSSHLKKKRNYHILKKDKTDMYKSFLTDFERVAEHGNFQMK